MTRIFRGVKSPPFSGFPLFWSKCRFLFSAFFLSMGSIFFWFFPAPFLYITYRRRWRVNKPKTHAQYIALWCTVHVPCGNSLQPFLHVWLQWYTMISTIIIEKELEMRLVNCSNVDRGRCLHSGSKFRSVHCVRWAGVASYTCVIRATIDAISSRCLCSTDA